MRETLFIFSAPSHLPKISSFDCTRDLNHHVYDRVAMFRILALTENRLQVIQPLRELSVFDSRK